MEDRSLGANEKNYNNLDTFIRDICMGDEYFYDLKTIVKELEKYHDVYSTFSMSDYTLFLKGKKEMLKEIIDYLKSITGEDDEE